jgi:hypothetical protein
LQSTDGKTTVLLSAIKLNTQYQLVIRFQIGGLFGFRVSEADDWERAGGANEEMTNKYTGKQT